ncbi:MAG: bL28 family ribosomal protein [Patescibacteria group bacterium]|jgi:ribosomal protein L28
MSMTCSICTKKAQRANYVSHSNVKAVRRQKPNLQRMNIDGKSVKICSSCRRTLVKELA